MGVKSKIEWCDATWNPVTGCYHTCEYCYARRMANRFGAGLENISNKTLHVLDKPAKGMGCGKSESTAQPYPYNFQPTFHRHRLDQPKKWVKPKTIFVCSMADLFGEWVPDSWIQEVFNACEEAPQHRYLFLTKNPKRYTQITRPSGDNFWFGTSICKVDDLERTDYLPITSNVFYSIEPIMEDLRPEEMVAFTNYPVRWLIIGAETGNRKDKVIPKKEWIDHICEVADERNIPVFMKDSLIPIVGEENMRREFPRKER